MKGWCGHKILNRLSQVNSHKILYPAAEGVGLDPDPKALAYAQRLHRSWFEASNHEHIA
jgi:hypothetical protein